MRLRAIFFAAIVFAGAGAAAYKVAEVATARYEAATADQLNAALEAAGQRWVSVATDGLKVTLAGAAPDETSRFRALEIARQIVDAGRVEDTTTLADAAPLPPAPFALELLRNESDVSLIGLVPETGGRDVIQAALRAGGLAANVTDMLESASDPAPEGWQEALGYGLSVLSELPRAKISVAPRSVRVIAVADSEAAREKLEEGLQRAKPEGIALMLELSAPRAVIAPFVFDFSLADGVGRLDACSAESEEAAAALLAAAEAAGLAAGADCRVGLGAPAAGWGTAAERGIDALKELGGGRFTLQDITAELTPPEGASVATLEEVAARLDTRLPDVIELRTIAPELAEAEGTPGPAPEFDAVLTADGAVRLSGFVTDATSQDAILSYAASLFGHDRVIDTTMIAAGLPGGWPGRVLAGVEALAALNEGKVVVTPETVAVQGWGLYEDVGQTVEELLAEKVGEAAVVHVTFNAEAAAAAESAARPRPEICAEQIGAILDAGQIQFGAGSADIVPQSRGVIAAIADVLRGCPGADFEIGGHTNSQGTAEANQGLSERRAQAVLAALQAQDLPMVRLTARGFGAGDPVGDNASVAGRASNRRIEFTLLDAEEVAARAAAEPEAMAEAVPACADAVGAILGDGSIQFDAGSATITPESDAVIEAIAGDAARLPRNGVRDRRAYRLAGVGERQPPAEPGPGGGGAGGAPGARPAAGGIGGAGLWRGGAGGRERHRRRAGAEPAHRLRADRAGGGGRRGGRAGGGGRGHGLPAGGRCGAGEGVGPVLRRIGDAGAGERRGARRHRRGAAGLPGRGDGDRRIHRFRGCRVRGTSSSARSGPRRCWRRCASGTCRCRT